jgi:hypothetical protein
VPPFELPTSAYPLPVGALRWVGSHSITATDGGAAGDRCLWTVWVYPIRSGGIARYVTRGGKRWEPDPYWVPEMVIWPTWTLGEEADGAAIRSGSPLEPVEDYWSRTGNRIRESSKWMAGVVGLALATLAGTSPLQGMRAGGRLDPRAIVLGALGFALLTVTLFLVLQVLRPQATSYTDVQAAGVKPGKDDWPARFRQWRNPLRKWSADIEAHADLYLPSGVTCLSTLRQLMVVDELTLMALSCALGHEGMTEQESRVVQQAQALRMARLREWRTAASRIILIGEFYRLRRRSAWATYAGTLGGVLGTAAIVGTFVWPW